MLKNKELLIGICLVIFLSVFIGQAQATKTQDNLSQSSKSSILETYGKLPLHFEANKGQTDGQVNFLSRGNGYTLFLTTTEAVLALRQPESEIKTKFPSKTESIEQKKKTVTVLRMKLLGANSKPQVKGMEELTGKSNYFIGKDPTKWHTNIPHYD